MATRTGKESDSIRMLKNLVELDYDAIEAYQAAIERLNNQGSIEKLTEFRRDHERHVQELGDVLRTMGESPPEGGDAKKILTKGKVVIAGMRGDDAILKAMKTNEDDTNEAYERAAQRTDLEPRVLTLLQRNLEDERRHRQWIQSRLGAAESATPSSPSAE